MGHPQRDTSSEPNVIYLDSHRPPRPKVVASTPEPEQLPPPLVDETPGFAWHRILWALLAIAFLSTISWAAWAL